MALNIGTVYFDAKLQTKSLLGDVRILQKELNKKPIELNIKPIFNKTDIDKITRSFTTVGKKLGKDLGKAIGKDIATQVSKSISTSLKDSLGKDFKLPTSTGKKIGEKLGEDIAKGAAKGGEKVGKGLADDVAKGAQGGGNTAGKTLADEFQKSFDSGLGKNVTSKVRSVVNSISSAFSKYLPSSLNRAFESGASVIQRSFELWKETGKKEGQSFGDAIKNHFNFGSDLWQQLTSNLPTQATSFAKSLGGQLSKVVPGELAAIAPGLMSSFKGVLIAGAVGIGAAIGGKIVLEAGKALQGLISVVNDIALKAAKVAFSAIQQGVNIAREVDDLATRVGVISLALPEEEELQRQAAAAAALSDAYNVTAKQVTEAQLVFAKAGFSASEVTAITDPLARAITATGEGAQQISDNFVTITSSFNNLNLDNADNAVEVMNLITGATVAANQDFASLAETFKAIPSLSGTVDELSDYLELASRINAGAGLRGSRGSTAIRNFVDEINDIGNVLGFDPKDAENNLKSINDLVDEVEAAFNQQLETGKTATQIYEELGSEINTRAIPAIRGIINTQGEAELEIERRILEGGTTLQTFTDRYLTTIGAGQNAFNNAVEGLLLRIGNATAPIYNAFLGIFSEITRSVAQLEIFDALEEQAETLREVFAGEEIQGGIRVLADGVAEILGMLIGEGVEVITNLIDVLKDPQAVKLFIDRVKLGLSIIEGAVKGIVFLVKSQLEFVFTIVESISDRLDRVGQTSNFTTFLDNVPKLLLRIKTNLENAFEPILDAVGEFIEVNGVDLTRIGGSLLEIVTQILSVIGNIVAVIIRIITYITKVALTLSQLPTVLEGVSVATNLITNAFNIILTTVGSIVSGLTGLVEIVSRLFGVVSNQLSTVFADVNTGISLIGSNLLESISGWGRGLFDGLTGAFNRVTEYINNLWSNFWSTITGREAGQNLGKAVGEAFASTFGIIFEDVKGILGSALDGADRGLSPAQRASQRGGTPGVGEGRVTRREQIEIQRTQNAAERAASDAISQIRERTAQARENALIDAGLIPTVIPTPGVGRSDPSNIDQGAFLRTIRRTLDEVFITAEEAQTRSRRAIYGDRGVDVYETLQSNTDDLLSVLDKVSKTEADNFVEFTTASRENRREVLSRLDLNNEELDELISASIDRSKNVAEQVEQSILDAEILSQEQQERELAVIDAARESRRQLEELMDEERVEGSFLDFPNINEILISWRSQLTEFSAWGYSKFLEWGEWWSDLGGQGILKIEKIKSRLTDLYNNAYLGLVNWGDIINQFVVKIFLKLQEFKNNIKNLYNVGVELLIKLGDWISNSLNNWLNEFNNFWINIGQSVTEVFNFSDNINSVKQFVSNIKQSILNADIPAIPGIGKIDISDPSQAIQSVLSNIKQSIVNADIPAIPGFGEVTISDPSQIIESVLNNIRQSIVNADIPAIPGFGEVTISDPSQIIESVLNNIRQSIINADIPSIPGIGEIEVSDPSQAIKGVLSNIKQSIVNADIPAIPGFGEVTISDPSQAIEGILSNIRQSIINADIPSIPGVGEIEVSDPSQAIQGVLSNIRDAIISADIPNIAGIGEIDTTNVLSEIELLYGSIENIVNNFSDLSIETLILPFKKSLEYGENNTIKTINKIKKIYSKEVADKIKFTQKSIDKFIKQLDSNINRFLKSVKNYIQKLWNDVYNFLTKGYKQYFKELFDSFNNILNRIITFITQTWERIKNYLLNGINNLWKLVSDGFQNLVSGLFNIVNRVWNQIRDLLISGITSLWSTIFNSFNNVVENIRTIVINAWEFIRNVILGGIGEFVNRIIDGANQAIVSASAIFTNGWNNIRQNVLNILGGLWSGIQNQISQISFSGLAQSLLTVRDAALNTLASFTDWVSTLSPIQFIVTSIENAFTNLQNTASRVQNILANFPTNIPVVGQLQGIQARQSPWAFLTERKPLAIPVIGKLYDIQVRNSPWASVSESNPYTIPLEGQLLDIDVEAIPVDLTANNIDLSGIDPTLIAFAQANPQLASSYLSANPSLAATIPKNVLDALGLAIHDITRSTNILNSTIEESGVTLNDLVNRSGAYAFGDPVYGSNENIFTEAGLAPALIDLIKSSEGFYPDLYIDPTGTSTIGFGTAQTAGEIAQKWLNLGTLTVEQANQALLEEIEEKDLEGRIKEALEFDPNINELSALISLAFNGGIGAVYDLLEKGTSREAIARNFPTHYTTSYGVPLAGLRNRRLLERELFVSEPQTVSSPVGAVDNIQSPGIDVIGVNLADVEALNLDKLFTKAVSGAIEAANDQESDIASAVLDAAQDYVGHQFNPGVVAQCMAFVRAVLGKANKNLGNKLDGLVNKVTTEAIDGLTTSSLLASSLFGGDIGTIIKDRAELKPGDLVAFYDTYSGWWSNRGQPTITHVGVYAGEDPTTGQQMIVDRSTSSAPVKYRPLDTFSNFAAGVRPFEYGDSGQGTSLVVDRESLQLDFGKLIGELQTTSVETVIETLKQASDSAESLGLSDNQIAIINDFIRNPSRLQALAAGTEIDFSIIPGVNNDFTPFGLANSDFTPLSGTNSSVERQTSLLEKIFKSQGIDTKTLSNDLKDNFKVLVDSFNELIKEQTETLSLLPSKLSEAERETLIQSGILKTGAVRLGEEYNILSLDNLNENINRGINLTGEIDSFLFTTNDYIRDMIGLVGTVLQETLTPQQLSSTIFNVLDIFSQVDIPSTLKSLTESLSTGSLESLFDFFKTFIPDDILIPISQTISRFTSDEGTGTQETLKQIGDIISNIDPQLLISTIQYIYTNLLDTAANSVTELSLIDVNPIENLVEDFTDTTFINSIATLYGNISNLLQNDIIRSNLSVLLDSVRNIINNYSGLDLTTIFEGLIESGSLNNIFSFLGKYISDDMLSQLIDTIDNLSSDSIDIFDSLIENFRSLINHVDTDTLVKSIIDTITDSSPDESEETLINKLIDNLIITPVKLESPDVEISLPNNQQSDIQVVTDEIDSRSDISKSSIAAKIAASSNPLKFQFSGIDGDKFVDTNQLRNLERTLNSPDFLEQIIENIFNILENDPQIRSELGLI